MTRLTITYGRKGGPRSGHIREGRRGVAEPSFTVTPGETPALRLNTDVGLRFPPDRLAKLPDQEKKLDYLRFEILGALDLFAQYQRRFLERYFQFITARCRDAAAELSAAVAWSGGLFAAEDYVFSALWPLPDVRITRASGDDDALGDFDFAFWTGGRVIGVTLTGGAAQPSSAARSDTAGDFLLPVTIAAKDLQDDPALFSEPRFPAELVSFWIGETVPSSPFRPVGLTDMQAEGA